MAGYLEKEEDRRRKLIEALAYPSLVLMMGIATFAVLLKFVIPKIASVYDDFGNKLPGITKFVLALSDLALPIGAVLCAAAAFLFYVIQKKKEWFALFVLRIPWAGDLVEKSFLSRFAALMALELQSGIPILTALESVKNTFSLSFFRNDLDQLKASLAQGGSIAASMQGFAWMKESARAVILSGEESGKLPEAFGQIQTEMSREFDSQVQFFLKFLERIINKSRISA